MNAHGKAPWLEARERGSRGAVRFMKWLALVCGRSAARVVLYPICAYFLLFSPRARRASREYLGLALGRRVGPGDLWRHFFSFIATTLDRIYFLAGQFDRFEIDVKGLEELRRILAGGRGCLLIGAHLGSFELLRNLSMTFETPVSAVMYEDNAANVMFMRDLIGIFQDTDLIAVPMAEQALEVARQRRPDLIVMDINLPGMSGIDALRQLRAGPETAAIPVIALTAAATERDRQLGLREGFYRYLTKPVNVDDFIRACESLFARGASPR